MSGRFKGTPVQNAIAVARAEIGPTLFARVAAAAPAETRALLDRTISPVEWIPIEHWMPFYDALFTVAFAGDEQKLRAYARKLCATNFNTVYRFMLKLATPEYLVNRVATLFRTFVDVGEVVVTSRDLTASPRRIEVELRDFAPYPLYALILAGYIEELLCLSGARGLSVVELDRKLDTTLTCKWKVSFA